MDHAAYFGEVDDALVRRATELRPLLAERAAQTEMARQVVPEVMAALEEAGLFEVLVPKRLGGLGGTMATQLAVAAELGAECASSAWVQTLLNITTWGASLSPGADELFGSTQRPRVAGVLAPTGVARAVPGGYRVSGEWGFASGSFYANWFNGGVFLIDEAGNAAGVGMATAPRGEFTIKDTWFVAGMSGTSSNTVVLEDVFVPTNRVTAIAVDRDRPATSEASDRWPLASALSIVLMGPLIGSARACADIVVGKAAAKAISYTSYGAIPQSMVAIAEIARAKLDIDTAWLHAFQAAAYVDDVGRGAPRDRQAEARLRGQCGYITAMVRQGIDTLLNVAGAGSFASANVLQRHWRDVNVGGRHAFLATNISLETYGRSLFGLDPVVVMV